MKKYGIFYGSATGTTARIADKLTRLIGVDKEDVHNVSGASPVDIARYETIILGSSTWGDGEVEKDWYDVLDGLQALDLSDHRIAIFGCGDETMADSFCNAVGIIYDRLKDTGATFIGEFDADGYTFHHSAASHNGKMRGLVLDEVNHPELTDLRLRQWAGLIKE